jgi:hypothetical protein
VRLRSLSTGVLEATLVVLSKLDVLPAQRRAIREELDVREWAAWVEREMAKTVGWCRGGRS